MKVPWRARLPWFAVWVPMALLLYTLVNGAGHIQVAYCVTAGWPNETALLFLLRAAGYPCGSWGFLIFPVLTIFAYVSWKLCPQWSPSIRWMTGMLGILLCVLFLLARAVLLSLVEWRRNFCVAADVRTHAIYLWRPHLCRPILEPSYGGHNQSPTWKAQAPEFVPFLRKHRQEHVRLNAIMILCDLKAREYIPDIALLLKDENMWVRCSASTHLHVLTGQDFSQDEAGVLAAMAWWDIHKNDPPQKAAP